MDRVITSCRSGRGPSVRNLPTCGFQSTQSRTGKRADMNQVRVQRIEQLRAGYDAMPPGGPAAARAANALGRQLAVRFFEAGVPQDRDAAIALLDEALLVPHDDATVTHAALGMLLFFRAMPIPIGADPDGSAAITLGMALMTGSLNQPERLADRERALGHLRWIIANEPLDSPVRQHATAMVAALRLVGASGPIELGAALGSLMEVAAGLGDREQALVGLLDAVVRTEASEMLRTRYEDVLRQLPARHRLRPLVMAEVAGLLAARGHLAGLPEDLAGLPLVLGDMLETMRAGEPLHEQTVRTLGGLLLSATAYTGDPDSVARLVQLSEDLVARAAEFDPVTAGKDRFLRAMARTLRGRLGATGPAALTDLRAAAQDLQAALAAVPPDDELHPAIAGMLGALLNDRHLVQGVLADHDAGERFLTGALADLGRYGGTDQAVYELGGLMSRIVIAVRRRDAGELDHLIARLETGLAALDAGYPWRSRLDAALGVAYLTRGVVRHDRGDLRSGVTLLRKAGDDLAVEVSGQPAMRAASALATFLDGLADGDRAAMDAAITQIGAAAADPTLPPAELVALHALRAEAAFAAGNPGDAIVRFEDARSQLPVAHPLAGQVHRRLAEAYRTTGRNADAVGSGLAALRAYGDDVLLQSGTRHGLATATVRDLTGLAGQVAGWCLDDDRPEPAVEALELGRGLVLHSATAGPSVPALLCAAGRQDLAEEWQTAPARADDPVMLAATEIAGVPSDLRPRVLAALHDAGVSSLSAVPGVAQIAALARAVDAVAVVHLVAGGDDTPGGIIVVGADGTVRHRRVPSLRGAARPVREYLAAHDTRVAAARDLAVSAPIRGPHWRERLAAVCGWGWPALIEPLLDMLGDTSSAEPHRVVLIAGDSLGYVPWHAARSSDGTRVACESFAFSYAASARQLAAVAGRPRTGAGGAVTLVADPTGDLPLARDEVEVLHRELYSGAVVLDRSSATPEVLLRQLSADPGPALLHLACHATATSRPDASYLLLAGRTPLPVDRILDVARTRPARAAGGTVVLSACSTDLTGSAFDEALTLATAFLAAGAVSVVGSRWPVDDRITACLMVMFHLNRAAGLTDRDALRAAQLWMLDPHRKVPAAVAALLPVDAAVLAEPSSWAPFAHHGR
jgi:tetratricopeptide (TPR) repeat protein